MYITWGKKKEETNTNKQQKHKKCIAETLLILVPFANKQETGKSQSLKWKRVPTD